MRIIFNLLFGFCLAANALHCEELGNFTKLDADPELVNQIKSLKDNQSLLLPAPKVIGPFNELTKAFRMEVTGPRSRDFTIKMVWAPDRERPIFCGANHGVPHRMNDVWEFDLASNTWVLLFAPTVNDRGLKDYSIFELHEGMVKTKIGLAPPKPAHTWWNLAYDHKKKAIFWQCRWPGYNNVELAKKYLSVENGAYEGEFIWSYYPNKNEWKAVKLSVNTPRKLAVPLEYIPTIDKIVEINQMVYVLDQEGKAFNKTFGGKLTYYSEPVTAWDEKNEVLVFHSGRERESTKKKPARHTYHIDFKKETIELAVHADTTEKISNTPNGHDASTMFYYDPIGQVSILYDRKFKELWAYDAAKKSWTMLNPEGGLPPPSKKTLGYFDQKLNVFVVTSEDGTWVYRYKAG